MQVIKVGSRLGSTLKHAVVRTKSKYMLAVRSKDTLRWIIVLQGPICPEVKRHFLNQLF